MQYFVAIEDTRELRWQAELLYESIRLLDLVDHFLVAICPGRGSIVQKPRYPNVVYFDNIGRRLGFPHLNKCYGLLRALETGHLKPPFVVLEPDMFLLNALPPTKAPVAAQRQKYLSWDKVDDRVKDMVIDKDRWVDVGGVYLFNQVSNKLYEDAVRYTHDLYSKYGNNPKWHTYGFNLAIANNDLSCQRREDYEMPLLYDGSPDVNWNSYIIHYKDGYPPYFHKEKVFDSINFSFKMPLPFKVLLEAPIQNQPNLVIMQTLIRSWLDSNLTRLHYLL